MNNWKTYLTIIIIEYAPGASHEFTYISIYISITKRNHSHTSAIIPRAYEGSGKKAEDTAPGMPTYVYLRFERRSRCAHNEFSRTLHQRKRVVSTRRVCIWFTSAVGAKILGGALLWGKSRCFCTDAQWQTKKTKYSVFRLVPFYGIYPIIFCSAPNLMMHSRLGGATKWAWLIRVSLTSSLVEIGKPHRAYNVSEDTDRADSHQNTTGRADFPAYGNVRLRWFTGLLKCPTALTVYWGSKLSQVILYPTLPATSLSCKPAQL